MTMTVVVTRNAPGRYRGFLASCMCEIAPGIYTAPRMSKAVRERVWRVLERWWPLGSDIAVVMTWPDKDAPSGQHVRTLGVPAVELFEYDGHYLARKSLPFEQE